MKQTDVVHDAVVFECDLPEPREKVWRALTERELLAAWLLPNDLTAKVGARFQLREPSPVSAPAPQPAPVGTSAPQPAPVECEVLEVEPHRVLRWRQREPSNAVLVESVVSFELGDLPDGGTHLRVVHDGFRTVARAATVHRLPVRVKAGTTSCILMRRAA